MNTKHTPGPWKYSRCDDYGDTRFYIAQQDGAPYTPNYSDVATVIAETVSLEYRSIQEANARLIAAAPELLEALKLMIDDDFPGLTLGEQSRRLTIADAAIAKATGASHVSQQ